MDRAGAPIDVITVTEQHRQSVRSASADIGVTFERTAIRKSSSSPMTGAVTKLRDELRRLGLGEDQIAIDRVTSNSQAWGVVGVAFALALILLIVLREPLAPALVVGVPFALRVTGLLNAPYLASCRVRIRAINPDQARQVVDLVTSMPHATLQGVSWRYDLVQPSPEWVQTCIGRANERARRIAVELGVEVLGVHAYAERWHLPDRDIEPVLVGSGMEALGPEAGSMRKAGGDAPEFASEGDAGVVVTIAYRISGFRQSAASGG